MTDYVKFQYVNTTKCDYTICVYVYFNILELFQSRCCSLKLELCTHTSLTHIKNTHAHQIQSIKQIQNPYSYLFKSSQRRGVQGKAVGV